MLLFWLLGPYAADAAINLCNCVYLCLLWPYTTSPARGVIGVLLQVPTTTGSFLTVNFNAVILYCVASQEEMLGL